jgi:hypothetical protein
MDDQKVLESAFRFLKERDEARMVACCLMNKVFDLFQLNYPDHEVPAAKSEWVKRYPWLKGSDEVSKH